MGPKTDPDQAQVARAAKLLQARGTGDAHRQLAVEMKIKQLPDHVVAQARATAGSGTVNTSMDAQSVTDAYTLMFNNQRTGLARLKESLDRKSVDDGVVAMIAGAAVGAAVGIILAPVLPELLLMIPAEQALARKLVEKGVTASIEKAKSSASEAVKGWKSTASDKKDQIADFIEAQSMAINQAQYDSIEAMLQEARALPETPYGEETLKAWAEKVHIAAGKAEEAQIVEAAGRWAELNAHGGDMVDWADKTAQGYRGPDEEEKGELEIYIKVDSAPIQGPADLQIVKSNWVGTSRNTEHLVQRQGDIPVSALGVNLRLYIEALGTEARCEIRHDDQGNPVIPENSTDQNALVWVTMGSAMETNRNVDRMAVVSAAAAIGSYIMDKTVGELNFPS